MKHGFIKVAAASPAMKVADCKYNAENIKRAIDVAASRGVVMLVFPELCVTGYTCGDLFNQTALKKEAEARLFEIAGHTKNINMLVVLGTIITRRSKNYNVAAVINKGEILGFVPKTFLPDYGEFNEQRYFAQPLPEVESITIREKSYPFGANLLFACREVPEFVAAAEVCEDIFVAISPSARHCLAGATIVANLSASSDKIGKPAYRRKLLEVQSVKNICGYIYCSSGPTESTTDVVFSSHNIIAENGKILAESPPFGKGYAETEIDVNRLETERARTASVRDENLGDYQTVEFSIDVHETKLTRQFSKDVFIIDDAREMDVRCRHVLDIQCNGLRKRIEHTGVSKVIVGVSGGMDSTLALLVAYKTIGEMKRPEKDIIAISMPCYGTTVRTKNNAKKLCNLIGVEFREIDITKPVEQHLAQIGHNMKIADKAFENAQARERTQILMNTANIENGLVIGTGTLSELALGWCTYNGDHMSMYSVNCGVPKTLVKPLIKSVADLGNGEIKKVLYDITETPISPELLPLEKNGKTPQITEDIIGPYRLHDFFLYYFSRWGYEPDKIRRVAVWAFDGEYSKEDIVKWLKEFLRKFFANQYKRSCMPDGPKIGSVGLSPRGEWRMPSDASVELWLEQLDK